jgi:protease-4
MRLAARVGFLVPAALRRYRAVHLGSGVAGMKKFVLLMVFLASAAAGAQGLPDATLGAVAPDAQSAAVNDGYAFLSNPAGLAGVERFQLVSGYSGRFSVIPEDHFHLGLASRAFGDVILGGQVGWVVAPPGARAGLFRSTGALAIDAAQSVRFGARVHGITPLRAGAETDVVWDLGLQLRPSSWLSIGLEAETLGAARPLAPGARAGISLRPFGEVLTLGVDTRVTAGSDDWFSTAFWSGPVSPAVNARLDLGGFAIAAGATLRDALSPGPDVEVGVSLIVDGRHAGATIAGGWRTNEQLVGGVFGRVSSEAFKSVSTSGREWIGLTLTGPGVPEQRESGLSAIFSSGVPPERVLAALERASRDPAVEGVALRLRGLSLGWGRAAELRAAIKTLRAAGKRVVVHMDVANDRDLFLATAADQVFVSPAAYLNIDGLRVELVYFREVLEKLGIRAQAFVAGDYKSGPRPLTHSGPSPEELEVQNALLDALYGSLVTAIVEGRGVSEQDAKAALDQGGLTPDEALERKLVDDLLYVDELAERLSGDLGHDVRFRGDYLDRVPHSDRWKEPPRIAIVPVVGEIRLGASGSDLFSGQVVGADDVVAALERVGSDPTIKAVVLRVDSPGGDALASDLIWRAVRRVQEKKPVIASMGDVAASGGYYVAAGAKEIYAEPETITGSIGVYSVMLEGSRLADDFGLRTHELKRGARPGGTNLRPFTAEESDRAQAQVDAMYARFQLAIRDGRDIDAEALAAVAGGRVWMGGKAKEIGLVDELGGVLAAISRARTLAELDEAESQVVVVTTAGGDLSPLDLMSRALGPGKGEARRLLRLLVGDPEGLGLLTGDGAPQARMPATLRVE